MSADDEATARLRALADLPAGAPVRTRMDAYTAAGVADAAARLEPWLRRRPMQPREQPTACQWCRRPTWDGLAVCERCEEAS